MIPKRLKRLEGRLDIALLDQTTRKLGLADAER
jgi:DNA-binding transcriptional LysR family regulator